MNFEHHPLSDIQVLTSHKGHIPINTFSLLCRKLNSETLVKFAKTVWGWGHNESYQLGTQHNIAPEHTYDIITLRRKNIVKISGGSSFSMILTKSGALYSWGINDRCQLGFGTQPASIQVAKRIPFSLRKVIVDFACGAIYTLAGSVYVWGIDKQLPRKAEVLKGHKIVKVFCSTTANTSFAVTSEGNLLVWGEQLKEPVLQPIKNVVDVACSTRNGAIVLDSSGDVYTTKSGVLNKPVYTPIKEIQDEIVVQISSGLCIFALLTKRGRIFVNDGLVTKEIHIPDRVISISCGQIEVIAATHGGEVWSFSNVGGTKFLDEMTKKTTRPNPQKMKISGKAFSVGAGASHFFALCED
ncbi:RCC1 and BTB domain-containing protein [Acrasis kona]|uniref:RCC1 and BTB domain-containing protein n=1 Tax=Acrasis kona TaxID=1008807 RepID=A0AAW2Z7N9_9EUKA